MITPFTFPTTGQQVRAVTIDGDPWFIAADICAALDITNVGNALARLDDDEHDARMAAEARIAEIAPAADAWGALADATGDYSVREAAQLLSRDPAITIGQNRLFAYLRDIRWVGTGGQQPRIGGAA